MHEKRLHGAKGGIGQTAALTLSFIVRHVEMLLVKEALELEVIRLDLSLGSSAEETISLSELQRVAEHVELRKCSLASLCTPVVLNILHCFTPVLDLLGFPFLLEEEMIVQLLQPALEGGISGFLSGSEGSLLFSSCAECAAAILLDPFANLGSVELKYISATAAAS